MSKDKQSGEEVVSLLDDVPVIRPAQKLPGSKIPAQNKQEVAKSPVSQPKMPSLTPEQLKVRMAQKARLQAGGSLQVKDFGPVLSTANPYMHLFREFLNGQSSLDEMNSAIDSIVMQDNKIFAEYEYKCLPTKPRDLQFAEGEFFEKIARYDQAKKYELQRAFYDEARSGQFAKYFYEADKIQAENRASVWQLQEMLSRQQDRNPIYASRIRAALMTHEAQTSR